MNLFGTGSLKTLCFSKGRAAKKSVESEKERGGKKGRDQKREGEKAFGEGLVFFGKPSAP